MKLNFTQLKGSNAQVKICKLMSDNKEKAESYVFLKIKFGRKKHIYLNIPSAPFPSPQYPPP